MTKLDEAERRAILEAIARDESNYPRERIAAVRELRDMDEAGPQTVDELERLMSSKSPRSAPRR